MKQSETLYLAKKLMGENSELEGHAHLGLGIYYRNIKNTSKSLFHIDKSISIYSSFLRESTTIEGWRQKGFTFQANGQYLAALECHHKALMLRNNTEEITDLYLTFASKNNPTGVPINTESVILIKFLSDKAFAFYNYYRYKSKQLKDLKAAFQYFQLVLDFKKKSLFSFQTNEAKLIYLSTGGSSRGKPLDVAYDFFKATNTPQYLNSAFDISELNKAVVLLQTSNERKSISNNTQLPKEILQKEAELKMTLVLLQKSIQVRKQKRGKSDKAHLQKLQNEYFHAYTKFESFKKLLETDYPDYYLQKYSTETVSIEALQSTLAENQTVLSYFIGEEKIYLFAITPDEYEVFAMDKPGNWEGLIRRYLQSIKFNQKDSFQQLSFELYQILLQEAVHHLIDPFEDEAKQVFIIPHAELHYLPFETLLIAEADTSTPYNELDYLLNHCQISYHYSATLLYLDLQKQNNAIAEAAPADFAFTGFAPVYESTSDSQKLAIQQLQNKEEAYATAVNRSEAVRSDGTWIPLPYSKIEVENIVQLFEEQGHKSQQFLYESATKNNLEQQIGKSRFVLIAAHGIVNDDYPELSGLVLADDGGREQEFGISEKSLDVGKLVTNSPSFEKHGDIRNENEENSDIRNGNEQKTIEDCILNMKEVAMIPMSADLVVLSSCESGIGELHKGEGMMAVNRGFLASGAKNVLSTLFKVNDKASSELTTLLFAHILKGENYSVALQKAKLELLEREKMSPKMWSGFVLFGKGNG